MCAKGREGVRSPRGTFRVSRLGLVGGGGMGGWGREGSALASLPFPLAKSDAAGPSVCPVLHLCAG